MSTDSDGHTLGKSPSNKGSHGNNEHANLSMLNHERRKSYMKHQRSGDSFKEVSTSLPMLNLKQTALASSKI
jgi:hypothetical protein